MALKTMEWTDDGLLLLDQTLLPEEKKFLLIKTPQEMWEAIRRLSVRGAPAIGDAAAFGVYLAIKNEQPDDEQKFERRLREAADYLATSRPTAVNLFWALDRMKRRASETAGLPIKERRQILLAEAQAILREDLESCRAIGHHGEPLIADGAVVLTHCNAGGLATAGYGTALAGIYTAHEMGKKVSVYADETRPLLQGSRITAFELMAAGVPVTLICDNMAPVVMRQGKIDLVIVGADRIAANGDTANKIGTYGVALAAREHKVPFYVAAPLSTIDLSLATGDEIPVEERSADEIRRLGATWTAPPDVDVYNPAFDVTPASMITAIITEKGVARAPYEQSLAKLFNGKDQ